MLPPCRPEASGKTGPTYPHPSQVCEPTTTIRAGPVEMQPVVTRHAPLLRRRQSMSTLLVHPRVRRI